MGKTEYNSLNYIVRETVAKPNRCLVYHGPETDKQNHRPWKITRTYLQDLSYIFQTKESLNTKKGEKKQEVLLVDGLQQLIGSPSTNSVI